MAVPVHLHLLVGGTLTAPTPTAGLWRAGLACRCPRCGQGALFSGLLRLRPSCAVCGLDFTRFESADAPSVLVAFLIGAVATAVALLLVVVADPPLWVLAVVLVPLVAVGAPALLRPAKALTVAVEYRTRWGEDSGHEA